MLLSKPAASVKHQLWMTNLSRRVVVTWHLRGYRSAYLCTFLRRTLKNKTVYFMFLNWTLILGHRRTYYLCLHRCKRIYIYIYIYIYTAVCKNFEPLIYISIYIYGVHCGKVLILENIPGHKKIIKCSHRKIFLLNILKISHVIHITLAGKKIL